MLAPAITVGGLTLATVALHFRDPHGQYSWGICPSAAMGFYCPGCGGLRAVNDLTNGQVGAALSSNIVVTLLIPVAIVLIGVWAVDRWQGRVRHFAWPTLRPGVFAFIAFLVAFAVFRNTDAGAWFAP
jgi:hypothetical protein